MDDPSSSRANVRARIIDSAARLLQESGSAAVTTRAVALGADVQAPAIYRHFGDKDGLLEAVAEHVMATYVSAKAETVRATSEEGLDPLVDLRNGWLAQIDFGLANPELFRLLSDPGRGMSSPAAQSGRRVLEARVHRVAQTGALRVSEQRAVGLIQAAGTGVIQTALSTPPEYRDPGLAEDLYEALMRHLLTGATPRTGGDQAAGAVSLRAATPQLHMLSEAERQLFAEWLDRIVDGLDGLDGLGGTASL